MENRKKTGERRNDIIDLVVDQLHDETKTDSKEEKTEFENNAEIDSNSITKAEFDKELLLIAQVN